MQEKLKKIPNGHALKFIYKDGDIIYLPMKIYEGVIGKILLIGF